MNASEIHLVIFLTPHIYDPMQPNTSQQDNNHLRLSQQALSTILESGLADIHIQVGATQ